MEIYSVLLSGVIGILGAVIGAYFTSHFTSRDQEANSKTILTLHLYSEFKDRVMVNAILKAQNIFKDFQNEERHAPFLYEEVLEVAKRREYPPIAVRISRDNPIPPQTYPLSEGYYSSIVYLTEYLEKISNLYLLDRLDKKFVQQTFGKDIIALYKTYYEPMAENALNLSKPIPTYYESLKLMVENLSPNIIVRNVR